ncbi:hypothetical protein AKO1_001250, partial [Acrasis kona]
MADITRSTIRTTSLWNCMRPKENEYVQFNPDTVQLYMNTISKLLLNEWREEFINNDSTRYRMHHEVTGYFFTQKESWHDRVRCDCYGDWKNNGSNPRQLGPTDTVVVTYFVSNSNSSVTKKEYITVNKINGLHRGLVVYFRPENHQVEPGSNAPHGNTLKDASGDYVHNVPFNRWPVETREAIRTAFANDDSQTPSQIYKSMRRDVHVPTPRDTKQCENVLQTQRNQIEESQQLERFALCHGDILRHYYTHPSNVAVLFTNASILALKGNKVWEIDTTFNMFNGYVTSLITQNKDFYQDPIQCGAMYLHQTLASQTHSQCIAYIKTCLDVKESDYSKYTVKHNGDHSLINALTKEFPGIKHLLCANHFRENIKSHLKYTLKVTASEEIDEVMETINGFGAYRGLLDYTGDEVKLHIDTFYQRFIKILGKDVGQQFVQYFETHKLQPLIQNVCKSAREEAGIKDGARAFTNAVESHNNSIKMETACTRTNGFYTYLQKLSKYMLNQSADFIAGYQSKGNKKLKANHSTSIKKSILDA